MVFHKKPAEPKEEKPFNPPFVKTDEHCIVEDCQNVKQPGQNAYCAKHVRT